MILAITANTAKECLRRTTPYLIVGVCVIAVIASHSLGFFSFGEAETEASNLAISAVFLAALLYACFVGSSLVRVDLERGTLALLLSQPVSPACYLGGRLLGLALVSTLLCAATAAAATGVMALLGTPLDAFGRPFLLALGRVCLAALVLDSAALAVSSAASRIFAPLLLLAVFLAGDAAGAAAPGRILPDLGLFALEARRDPAWPWLFLYAVIYCGVFLTGALLLLGLRPPVKSEN